MSTRTTVAFRTTVEAAPARRLWLHADEDVQFHFAKHAWALD